MPEAFVPSTRLYFPSVTVVTASAGAGKTHALTHRYVRLLLSDDVPHHSLANVLAITFTNNAATEMKQRILKLLKLAVLGDEETLAQLAPLFQYSLPELQSRAGRLLETILDNYSDFQVRTIDSFMSMVYKTMSLEYGIPPGYEISFDAERVFDAAMEVFSREIAAGSPRAAIVEDLVERIAGNRRGNSSYLWNPFRDILSHLKEIHRAIGAYTKPLIRGDSREETKKLEGELRDQCERVLSAVGRSGLTPNGRFLADAELLRSGNALPLIDRTLKPSPVNKPKGKAEAALFDRWEAELMGEHEKFTELLRHYAASYAESFYSPYVAAFEAISETVDAYKRREGIIFLEEVGRVLAGQLTAQVVPEVFYKLGESIFHYLIDEFQDTSRIQWANLFPLLEESLSKGGSLFVVGDTKQSIYAFRAADWRIMRELSLRNPFPSARHEVLTLGTNYRSEERIVEFGREIFHTIVPSGGLSTEAAASGLSEYEQEVIPVNRGKGIVEVSFIEATDGGEAEREKILDIVRDCRARGYRLNEIGVLAAENDKVSEISGWLNEAGYPIISHSTLDLRRRKSEGELVALLRFLDSPLDDLSFAEFVLGDLFANFLVLEGRSPMVGRITDLFVGVRGYPSAPLYALFRERFPDLWKDHFERLFAAVGYFPLYDLVTEITKTFRLFESSPGEEATLTKFLEVIRIFEAEGSNSLKSFLDFSADETSEEAWKIEVPRDLDAVQLMTIHKAKGLEFPVVILLLRDRSPKAPGYVVREEEEGLRLFRATESIGEKVEEIRRLSEEEEFRRKVDSLNVLYVALTRAGSEMYVLGLQGAERKEPTRFLPEPAAEHPPRPVRRKTPSSPERRFEPRHRTGRMPSTLHYGERLIATEARRGDVLHHLLSRISDLTAVAAGDLTLFAEESCAHLGFKGSAEEVAATARRFLQDERFRDLFTAKEGRSFLREQELAARTGALFRADRIVLDPHLVTVVDFKTGGDENETEYLAQVRSYMEILRDIYGERKIAGAIAYVDLLKLREVA